MLQPYIIIMATVASFIGSINGLGVTFLVSLSLYFIDKGEHHSYLWLPYISTFIVSFIFVASRLRIIIVNLVPILCLCSFSAIGLIGGKIFTNNFNLLYFKILLGIIILTATLYFGKLNYFSRFDNQIVVDEVWYFSFADNLVFLLIGFLAGFFEFSLAVFVYSYLIFNKHQYKVEHLDVCIYCVLAVTSFINFISSLIRYGGTFPGFLSFYYFIALLAGALLARFVYRNFSLEFKRRFILSALFFLGLKLIILNIIKAA